MRALSEKRQSRTRLNFIAKRRSEPCSGRLFLTLFSRAALAAGAAAFTASESKRQSRRQRRLPQKPDNADKPKIPMSRFMTENEHARERADRAAEKRKQQQDFFGNAPHSPFCLELVRPVHDERRNARRSLKYENADEKSLHNHPSWFVFPIPRNHAA